MALVDLGPRGGADAQEPQRRPSVGDRRPRGKRQRTPDTTPQAVTGRSPAVDTFFSTTEADRRTAGSTTTLSTTLPALPRDAIVVSTDRVQTDRTEGARRPNIIQRYKNADPAERKLMRRKAALEATAAAAGIATVIVGVAQNHNAPQPTSDYSDVGGGNGGGIAFGREHPKGWETYGAPISHVVDASFNMPIVTLTQASISGESEKIPADFLTVVTALNTDLNKTHKAGQQPEVLDQKFVDRLIQAYVNPAQFPEYIKQYTILNNPNATPQERQAAIDSIFDSLRKQRNSAIPGGANLKFHQELLSSQLANGKKVTAYTPQ